MEEIMEPSEIPDWASKPDEIPKKTIGRNGNLLNVGGTYPGNGRPKGKKSRSTILKHYMNLRITRQDPLTGIQKTLPLESFMELEMLAAILEDRDISTYKEVKDTLYGKLTDSLNVTGDVDLSSAIQLKIEFEKPNHITEPQQDGN